ncbi:hypothetical protein Bca4012_033655 [Brassica carinata]
MDLPVAGSSPSPCLPPEPPDAELYVRLPVDPPDPPVPPPTLHRLSGPMLFTARSRHFAPPLSITVNRKVFYSLRTPQLHGISTLNPRN